MAKNTNTMTVAATDTAPVAVTPVSGTMQPLPEAPVIVDGPRYHVALYGPKGGWSYVKPDGTLVKVTDDLLPMVKDMLSLTMSEVASVTGALISKGESEGWSVEVWGVNTPKKEKK